MRMIVSQGTIYSSDGQRMCSRCGRRPVTKGPRRYQSLCKVCHADDMAERRAGMVEVLLTPEEWAAVKLARKLHQPLGRHHRGD